MLEVGGIRAKNSRSVIYKNLIDIFMVTLTYWGLGYGISTNGGGGMHGTGGFFDFSFSDKDYR